MYEGKKLIVFDLDGTLAESKSKMDSEMSDLISRLLKKKRVAVISGGAYKQYKKQFLASLDASSSLLCKLHLFPTCSTSYYKYEKDNWNNVYEEIIPENIRKQVLEAFEKSFVEAQYSHPDKVWGEVLEDRETQITMSALGQKAPTEEKKVWDPDQRKRKRLVGYLTKNLPDGYEARIGGSTSIDVTKEGISKTYGIQKIMEYLGVTKDEILFIGDALFEGGNDYPVKEFGVECISVDRPNDTKEIIKDIIS